MGLHSKLLLDNYVYYFVTNLSIHADGAMNVVYMIIELLGYATQQDLEGREHLKLLSLNRFCNNYWLLTYTWSCRYVSHHKGNRWNVSFLLIKYWSIFSIIKIRTRILIEERYLSTHSQHVGMLIRGTCSIRLWWQEEATFRYHDFDNVRGCFRGDGDDIAPRKSGMH